LLLAVLPLAAFGLLVQRRVRSWWLLLPLAGATWFLVHESGVHATVAGVLLAFTVPVRRRAAGAGPDRIEHQPPPAGPQEDGPQEDGPGLAERFEHRLRPVSAGVAVPVFAFFSSGVSVAGTGGLGASLRDSVTIGVVAGLVAGKAAGVTGATWLVQRFTRARLDPGLGWWDVFGLALLGGVGFTVALLIAELAYGVGSVRDGHAKIGILLASLLSALLATVVLRLRNRHYRRLAAEEEIDSDDDGIPDVYQR
jgi:NhaA family Na+:H+ antiporter